MRTSLVEAPVVNPRKALSSRACCVRGVRGSFERAAVWRTENRVHNGRPGTTAAVAMPVDVHFTPDTPDKTTAHGVRVSPRTDGQGPQGQSAETSLRRAITNFVVREPVLYLVSYMPPSCPPAVSRSGAPPPASKAGSVHRRGHIDPRIPTSVRRAGCRRDALAHHCAGVAVVAVAVWRRRQNSPIPRRRSHIGLAARRHNDRDPAQGGASRKANPRGGTRSGNCRRPRLRRVSKAPQSSRNKKSQEPKLTPRA
ncbi:hypothetical protein CA12_32990 [Alienimonas californiensis]|uniref:Uncharacterized protein n=1 Tax=Alienimonas californiensis TaxID=2527989 RepID=A0A517PCT2_9PLAN|nr:hypothetical protein CA12_32990 [Alienimonas californiensis]